MSNPFTALSAAASALWSSFVRTIVPYLVGSVGSFLVSLGLDVDPGLEASLGVFLTLGFGTLWYVVGRVLEVYVSPKFGWLLGLARTVKYTKTPVG